MADATSGSNEKENRRYEGRGDRRDDGRADGRNGEGRYEGRGQGGYVPATERAKAGAMEVHVDNNIEKAMKILKRKLIKEGLFKELKMRRYYEKPSVKRKRKSKEAIKKMRKDEARQKKNQALFG